MADCSAAVSFMLHDYGCCLLKTMPLERALIWVVRLAHTQITQELREYAQKHQMDEEEAAQVRFAVYPLCTWDLFKCCTSQTERTYTPADKLPQALPRASCATQGGLHDQHRDCVTLRLLA